MTDMNFEKFCSVINKAPRLRTGFCRIKPEKYKKQQFKTFLQKYCMVDLDDPDVRDMTGNSNTWHSDHTIFVLFSYHV